MKTQQKPLESDRWYTPAKITSIVVPKGQWQYKTLINWIWEFTSFLEVGFKSSIDVSSTLPAGFILTWYMTVTYRKGQIHNKL